MHKKEKAKHNELRHQLTTNTQLLFIGLLLTTLLGFCLFMIVLTHDNQPSNSGSKSTNTPNQVTRLTVESEPKGISIAGSPDCDSTRNQKITPYLCTAYSNKLETVLRAPDVAFRDGQSHSFKTWDGCSESNDDRKICKVTVSTDKMKTAKASYQIITDSPPKITVKSGEFSNDQACTITTIGEKYRTVCTINIRKVPSAGYTVTFRHTYSEKATESCGEICATYGEDQSIYHSWPVSVNVYGCHYVRNKIPQDCSLNPEFKAVSGQTILKPAQLTFTAQVTASQYYGYGCKFSFCYGSTDFKGWHYSLDNGNPLRISVVADYKALKVINPDFVPSPETDRMRENLSAYQPF